jgi:hypothetical protein
VVTIDLMTRARAGDGEAFGDLVDPYRRELQLLPPRQRAVLILRDVLTLAGSRIRAITRFDNSVLPRFGLPRILPD